ncbi:VOC family protein [Peribacillus frigoritolerans]
MGSLVHLEIHVDDMKRAKKFYKSGSGTRLHGRSC